MEKKLLRWEWWGAVVCVLAGSALHFAYPWSHGSPIVALFAPVNESVWEHLKLGLWPLGILSVLEWIGVARGRNRWFPAKLAGIVSMMLFIVLFFYGYNAVLHRELLVLDIGSFVAGVALCQAVSLAIVRGGRGSPRGNAAGAAGLLALVALFMIVTWVPPRWELFRDPPTGTYGAGRNP
jgi:hypothetical protein